MTQAGRFRSRRTVAAGSALLLAVLGGSLAAPAHAAPVPDPAPVDCPTAYPLTSVDSTTVGQGFTVVSGTEPAPFKVEVLSVLKNGIGAGKDLILVKLSDLPGQHVIDQAGGGFEGISGSPVYVNGQLLGSVSYGFTAAPSPIAGVTPAAYMTSLFGGAAAHHAERASAGVKLSTAARKHLAAQAGAATPRGSLEPFRNPLGVSGLSSRRVANLQSRLDHADRPFHVYAAGGSSGSVVGTTPTARPVAGGNFALSVAAGDFDAFAVGTTTLVCGNQAVAWGHGLFNEGPVSYLAHVADTAAIVKDDTFGSYKMATLGATAGTVNQDRSTGIRADLTRTPDTTAVTTNIDDADTGASRTGTTQVSNLNFLSGLLPDIVNAGQDAVFDERGDGVATSAWTIRGTRAGGQPLVVSRSNSWASRYDITEDPAYDLAFAADQIVNNDYENVKIDSITFDSTMKTKYHQRHITTMSVSVNGGKFSTAKRLNVKVGDKLRLHVGLKEYRGIGTKYTTIALTVPKKAKGQVADLSVVGGVDLNNAGDSEDCLFDDDCTASPSGSLNKIISSITSAPRNNTVVAQLSYDNDNGDTVTAAQSVKANTLTVTGGRGIVVRVR